MTVRSAIAVGVLIILDQVTKSFVSARLQLGESIPVFENVFHITLIHNSGAAFGIFKGMLAIFILLSLVTIFLIICYAKRFLNSSIYLRTDLLFILAGTAGNLIDRIRFGYVIDFIDLRVWPIFNIADMTITIGAFFLVYHILSNK